MRTQHHSRSSSGSTLEHKETVHVPVLLQEILATLNIQKEETVLDGTLGGGGHAKALALALGTKGLFIGIDTDSKAIQRAIETIGTTTCSVIPAQSNFRHFDTILSAHGVTWVDAALFDLGLSSDQLENSHRGFSFKRDEPLSMNLTDADTELTAEEIVNEWQEESLADIIYGYGGERYARRIAKAIVTARETARITSTSALADIIRHAYPAHARFGNIHPATKTFQALRITVNDELGALKEMLDKFPLYAHSGTRLAIISFHSLEDKIVKNTFKAWRQAGRGATATKKPITPSIEEVRMNPRSRSSKLRVFIFS